MNKNSPFAGILFILIAGMGNVKHGNWRGIIVYFTAIGLIGIGLYFAEQKIIESYYQPSQTLRTFAALCFITFAFFWNGTKLLSSEVKDRIFDRTADPLSDKHTRD